ncbi:protein YIPF2 [Bombina bombina]|uniref:protein YIPF2 n=1 Tax=Bombina bombina TaxID=8345 RepID=UPI00235AD220|nr:protein YIPF2 [Bombina bombina]XP_053573861.1 protein YIPF2 [Bombina bombina]XP_053573862.1 protein YIPF2 [Bombina bombina]
MATADDLKFQEFDEAADLLAATPNATTKSVTEENQPQHATLHMGTDSDGDEGDTDQTELLASQKKPASFWTFQYYQDFFDVDTYQVLDRIKGSLLPIPGKNFVRHNLRNNPDLYGPFWICATLVFTVTIMGNLSTYIQNSGSSDYQYSPQFHKVSVAAIAIYSYAWLIPLGLWGFLQWRKGVNDSVGSYSFLETVCVYGYSLFVYIPTTVLWLVPYELFRWILILVAMSLSGSVLILTFWPHIRRDNKMVAIATVGSMVALHALLAVGCKMYFFEESQKTKMLPATTTTQKMHLSTKH